MVFMGADTIAGNAPLIEAAEADLAEMGAVGSGGQLNIFAQVHGSGLPRRTHVGITPLTDVPADESDPARGRALASFIGWALATAQHDPRNPNHYTMLVLWGHAYDFAVGRSQTRTGTIDALDFAQLTDVLERLQEASGMPSAKLDILGFDACDLATVEMACQLDPFARYLLGSQIGIPIPGWPYDRILDRLRHPIRRIMGPAELGSYVVRRFCESYTAADPVSLSLLHLDRARDLFARGEVLALTLSNAIADSGVRDQIARLFLRSQTGERRPYVDVADLCLSLVREAGDPLVVEAARAMGDFLISPQPPLVGKSADGSGHPFVVEHGRNAGATARLNGVSLYAPHVALANDVDSVRHLYRTSSLRARPWSGLVHMMARMS